MVDRGEELSSEHKHIGTPCDKKKKEKSTKIYLNFDMANGLAFM